jgi:hypothetical protein
MSFIATTSKLEGIENYVSQAQISTAHDDYILKSIQGTYIFTRIDQFLIFCQIDRYLA